MWMGTVNMNFFIISLARIEPHSFALLRPACFGALPSSPARLRFVRRWRARRGPGPARPGRSRWRWGAPRSRRLGGRFAIRNLANFLRPLAPGRRTIRLPGLPKRQLSEGQELLGAAIRAVSARLPSVAQRLAPGRRTEVFSPPSPATSQSPKGSGPAACGPRQPLGFGIFFFPFMTQLARLYSPITGDSA